jgi:Helix-turn-helix domain
MDTDELTIKQVARVLDMNQAQVYEHVWEGDLKARKRNGRWVIARRDVQEFLKARVARQQARVTRLTELSAQVAQL